MGLDSFVAEVAEWWTEARGKDKLLTTSRRLALYQRASRFASRGMDVGAVLGSMLKRANIKRQSEQGGVAGALTRWINAGQPGAMLEGWIKRLNNGELFSAALGEDVPAVERMAISAGEETGDMEAGFTMAAYIVESTRKIKSTLWATLAYPIVLILAMGALLVLISYQVMPVLIDMYPLEFWPTIPASMYYLATAVRKFGLVFVVVSVAGIAVSLWSLPRWTGALRK